MSDSNSLTTLTNTVYGNYTINSNSTGYQFPPYTFTIDPISNLSNLNYDIYFSVDIDDQLKNNVVSVDGNLIVFNCEFVNKDRIQPYELIMRMISEKIKFNIRVEVSDILTIKYNGVKFKRIENNFSFINNNCNFNTLKVKMKYKNVTYDNHKLCITEKRKEKLKKIMEI